MTEMSKNFAYNWSNSLQKCSEYPCPLLCVNEESNFSSIGIFISMSLTYKYVVAVSFPTYIFLYLFLINLLNKMLIL